MNFYRRLEDDPMFQQRPGEFRTELHDRIIAPIYPFVFVLMAFAALGAPRTNRQNRNFAIAVLIVGILVVRIAGFGFSTVGAKLPAAIIGQYAMLAFVCAGSLWLIARGVIIDAPSNLFARCATLDQSPQCPRDHGRSHSAALRSAFQVPAVGAVSVLFVIVVRRETCALNQMVALGCSEVFLDHFRNELLEADLRRPAKFLARLGRVTEQAFDFRRPEVACINGDDDLAIGVVTLFVDAFAFPGDLHVEHPCGDLRRTGARCTVRRWQ